MYKEKKIKAIPHRPETEEHIKARYKRWAELTIIRLAQVKPIIQTLDKMRMAWSQIEKRTTIWQRSASIYINDYTTTLHLHLSAHDKIIDMLQFFEIFETIYGEQQWNCSDLTNGRKFEINRLNGTTITIYLYLEKNLSCKIIPIYETKKIRVGQKVVC